MLMVAPIIAAIKVTDKNYKPPNDGDMTLVRKLRIILILVIQQMVILISEVIRNGVLLQFVTRKKADVLPADHSSGYHPAVFLLEHGNIYKGSLKI